MRGLTLWQRILIALIAGLIVGGIAGEMATAIKPVGTVFINLIKMLIIPLVFSTLVVGAASTGDLQRLGRIGGKTIGLYLLTTAVAITIGLLLGTIFQPGIGVTMQTDLTQEAREAPGLVETLLGLVPTNPIRSLANGDILQIIVFALFTGVCISMAKVRAKPVLNFFDGFAEVMFQMTAIVMDYAPYGVFALIAAVAGQYGLSVLLPLAKVIVLVYIGCIIHAAVVYGTMVKVWARLNPIRFFKGVFDAMVVAFTTTSSSATLPVTMRCVRENLGVSKDIASFVLPLGATINMDGTALYQGVCALFVAQVYGVSLSFGQYVTIIITATLASIGTAGVPGAGLIMLTLVLKQVGLPLEGIALIAGIDRVLDMARTCINVTGDSAVASVVASSEHELTPPLDVKV
ncbi:cation:dicarboxylase symporter family transporter [candidate division KSB3 bacterium]|uniref:Cation:dicarboxylase symporter family transporter n=1 Tax=candidate division KSB3 bacterium TaxID=2044937 RepID=A0A9D5JV91_9BACT|nr:cation:dicarboxylase symporter family transporter [candidate division KSB3 bacterium]MBD3324790.1 cation:dicarboxylase symporter family transporter [candidate division KSB3 bacterium]